MGRKVLLGGTVGLSVTVDMDTRKVLEVIVWDDSADLLRVDTSAKWAEGTEDDYNDAVAIADEAPWPKWKFAARGGV
jgi:hypothetical protein